MNTVDSMLAILMAEVAHIRIEDLMGALDTCAEEGQSCEDPLVAGFYKEKHDILLKIAKASGREGDIDRFQNGGSSE